MDKNTIYGFALIFLIMFGFSWFNQPSQKEIDAQKRYQDSIALVEQQQKVALENPTPTAVPEVDESTRRERLAQTFGDLAKAMFGKEQEIKVSNEVVDLTFSTKGGKLSKVVLKNYDRYDSLPLVVFDQTTDEYGFYLTTKSGQVLNTANLYFNKVTATNEQVVMRMNAGLGSYMDFVYTIKPGSYLIDFEIRQKNMDLVLSPRSEDNQFFWTQKLRRQEKGRRFEEQYSNLFYRVSDDDVDYLSSSSDEKENFTEELQWIGYKNQFFSSVIIAKEGFQDATLDSRVIKDDEQYLKNFKSKALVTLNLDQEVASSYIMYIGPNLYPLLNEIDDQLSEVIENPELDELVPLGWSLFRYVNKLIVIPVFTFLGKYIHNYGIIILLLTIFIKLLLSPFTFKSYLSQAKMRILRPEIESINNRYPGQDNAMQRQQETMKLYSSVGVSPMGGCLPMLLQMPILFALFQFFPSSIELRGQSFLWAHDLSSYDSIVSWSTYIPIITPYFGNHISLFCLLMTVTNLVYIHMNMKSQPVQEGMQSMRTVQYLMPIMFMAFFNNYAAGLSYYYFLSLLITILQTWSYQFFINEDKLRKEMKDYQRKPKKPSGFMARLQEAARQQQEMQARQQNKK